MVKGIISLIVFGALAFGLYTLNQKEKEQQQVLPENVALSEENQEGKKMAFSQFLKMGTGSYDCTVNQYVNDIESQGRVFLDNGKIRGDFNTTVQGMNVATSVIVRDDMSYTWTSMGNMGFKVPIVEAEGDVNAATSDTYSWDGTDIGDYDCVEWSPEASKFDLPTGINFQDIPQM